MARLAFSATGDSAKGHDTFASPKKFQTDTGENTER